MLQQNALFLVMLKHNLRGLACALNDRRPSQATDRNIVNILHTNAISRCRLARLIAAAAVGAAMLLGGCASEGPFTKNARGGRDEPAQNQAKADSFPTAQEAGISR
jgi:hypothetical protein